MYLAVQYDKENGFTTWFSKFKEDIVKISDEVNDLFKNIIPNKNDTESWLDLWEYVDENGWDNFITKNKIADENFKEFLKTIDKSKFTIQSYQQYLKDTGEPITAFTKLTKKASTALKSFGSALGSMVINWLIGKAIDVVATGIDNWIHSMDNTQKELEAANNKIEEINSELETTSSRIDELNAKENLSLVEAEELDKLKETNKELERELRLNQEIAKVKSTKANKEALLYFDRSSGSFWENLFEDIKTTITRSDYFADNNTLMNASPIFFDRISEVNHYIEMAEKLKETLSEMTNTESKEYKSTSAALKEIEEDIAKTISDFMQKDDMLLEGEDNGLLERLDFLYEKYDIYTNGKASVVEDKLSSILAKSDFAGYAKELEQLGKTGELSLDVILSKFPNLVSYLDEAGISAQELYHHIMALSNPDAVNYANVKRQLLHSISGQQDGTPKHLGGILSAGILSGSNILNLSDILSLGQEELVLDAYLKVRAQYGDSPEGWTVEDWIYNIQQKLNANPITLENSVIPFSSSDTITQLNTRLKPALDSLSSAWNNIFTDDEFALNSIDILSTCDSIKSKLDELNEIEGITVDYSSFEDFVRILSDSESESEDIKNAFESLAASITQAALSGTEDFETMKAALEDLGVVNNEIAAFDALARNTGALKEAGLDLAEATDEQIFKFADERVSAENLTQAIAILTYQKKLCELQGINTSTEIANLRTLAENAGYTAETIQYLTELEQIYQQIENGTIDPTRMGKKIDRIVQLKSLIEGAAGKIDYKPIEKGTSKAASSAGKSAGKDAAKAFTDALDKELAALDKKTEAGYIDFNEYIQARLALIENYYNQGKLSADEYYSYLEKHYDTQLSYMDKVVNAVTRRIDTEIDALKQQKEDVENIYETQIESLEEEKALLEAANKERQRQKDLQKSLYDMERAGNQRIKLVYTEDKGMIYQSDPSAMRDAQESIDNARYETQIAEIEKAVSNLEEVRDKETGAIDEMISSLESYKDAWSNISSAYEEEQENLIAAQVLGANWEADILNSRLDVLNDFKNEYMSIQQAMVDAAWKFANEQGKAAKEAEKGSSGSTYKAPKNDDTIDTSQSGKTSDGGNGNSLALSGGNRVTSLLNFKAYASGTNNAKKGLNLVGEDGAEAYFDNHGHVAIVTKPTLIPMDGGEVVKNERDTKKLLDSDNLAPVDTIGLADIDGKDTFTLLDGTALTSIQPGTFMWDLQEKFNTYINKTGKDVSSIMSPIDSIQKDMARKVNSISTVNNITGNGMQHVTIGDINVTCPGVTEQQVAKQVGGVIAKELNRQFSGFSNYTDQQSRIR